MREIRLQYVHRGQTYLTASRHSYVIFVIFLIGRRDGENNGFLVGVPLLPPPSRVVSRPNSLPLSFENDLKMMGSSLDQSSIGFLALTL